MFKKGVLECLINPLYMQYRFCAVIVLQHVIVCIKTNFCKSLTRRLSCAGFMTVRNHPQSMYVRVCVCV